MGKIRAVKLGDEEFENEQKRRADARRQTKQSKKTKVEGVGLKGGERTAMVEGTTIKPEFRKLIEEVESGAAVPKAKGKKDKEEKKGTVPHQRSKRYQEMAVMVDKNKLYPLTEAVVLVKKTSLTKFDGTVEIHITLNPNTMGGKKDLRGSVSLPHGTGKQIKVVEATDEIIADITDGKINFDVLVATPSMMPKLARVARILGPKGIMPNPKTGTVTDNPAKRIKELSQGQINFKTEQDNPLIHLSIGKVSFTDKQLSENVNAVIAGISSSKISRITLTSTMGPGIKIQI